MNRVLLIVLTTMITSGCATVYYTPPEEPVSQPEISTTVEADFDKTWEAIIDHASSTFFMIDNLEKASGLVTVSFGSSNPSTFVDCGTINAGWVENLQTKKFNGPYVEFMEKTRDFRLTGKMNISARPASENETTIRVNARYVLRDIANGYEWAFDSDGQSTVFVSGSQGAKGGDRTCQPTHEAEQTILNSINNIAR